MQAALSHKLGSQIEEKGESDLSISIHLFLWVQEDQLSHTPATSTSPL